MKKNISMFVLLLVVAGLMCGLYYTCNSLIQKDKEITALTQENTDLKQRIQDITDKLEIKQDEKTEDKTPVVEDKKEETKEEIKLQIPVFDQEKVSNKKENTTITEKVYAGNSVISAAVEADKKSIVITLNADLARQVYGYIGQSETHTVAGFNSNVVDVKVVSTSKSNDGVKVILLMEDGSVKYIKMTNILDKTYTVQTATDVENTVKITEVIVSNNETGESKIEVVAIKNDGTAKILGWE